MDLVWCDLHANYQKQEWIDQPSIFAETAIGYFPKTGKLLELGAGHGQDSVFFAEKGYEVTSTDIEISALKMRLAEKKIDVQQIDLRKPLPFHDGCFDVVYAHLAIHYFDQKTTEAIIREIARVLKPKGILAFLVNSTSDPEYATGKDLEKDFFQIDKVTKRYFNVESARAFTKNFKPLLLDNQGQTYKDQAKGISHLIRFIGRI